MRKIFLYSAFLIICLLTSCKSQFDLLLEGHDVDKKYTTAFELFEQGKYSKAALLFENLQLVTKGTIQEDTVLFYTALSHYKYKDYFTAEPVFETFVATFPRSPFTEEGNFLRLDCMYKGTYRWELDQAPTRKTITNINEYLIDNPNTKYKEQCQDMLTDLYERLDKKSYESAKLYYTIEDYKAAHYALKNVLKDNAENIYRENVMYYICMSSYKYAFNSIKDRQRERYMIFVDDYYNFITEYPESSYKKELEGLFDKAQSALQKR